MQSRTRWLARPWSAEGAVKPRELQQLRERYARLTDVDLVRMHSQGPGAFASAEVWGLLDQEWHQRRAEIERTDQEEQQRSRAQLPITLSNAVARARRWARLTNTLLKTEMAICGGVMVTILGGATGWGAWQPIVIWGVFTLNTLALVIAWLRWQHQAYRNLTLLDDTDTDHSLGWSVGCWFVPPLSFFVPFQVVTELYQRSMAAARAEPAPPSLRPAIFEWWWALWLGAIVVHVGGRLFASGDLLVTLVLLRISMLIAAAVCAVRVVEMIQTAQEGWIAARPAGLRSV